MNSSTRNVFEAEARERKAQAIARCVWRHTERSDRTNPAWPAVLEQAGTSMRNILAEAAGQNAPSDETWARVVELVAEKVADERHWFGLGQTA